MSLRWSRRRVVQGARAVGLGLLAGCGRLPGQGPATPRIVRIGFLWPTSAPIDRDPAIAAFEDGLREYGWVPDQDLIVELRYADNQPTRLPDLATQLISLPVDVIVGVGIAVGAAMQVTRTVPIVMVTALDPVGSGYVDSLSRPGGNVTGVSLLSVPLSGKRLELLKEVAVHTSRMAVLWNPEGAGRLEFAAIQDAANVLGVEVQSLEVYRPEDLSGALGAVLREGSGAVLVQQAATFAPPQVRQQIVDFAAIHRLPAMYVSRSAVETGGLMAYGPSVRGNFRRAAYYVDRLLRGAKPADLPVEQPREFELVINLRTAHALGLTIPHHVLLQATEVIQ